MFSTKTKVILSALTALVVVGLIIVLVAHPKQLFGAASTPGVSGTPTTLSGGSVPSLYSALEASESFISDGPQYLLGILNMGSSVTGTLVKQQVSTGSCAQTSTSTILSVQNPFSATSTVLLMSLSGTVGATTTDILVGTSTTPNPAGTTVVSTTTATVGQNLFGMFSIATTTQFYSVAGVTMGPGTGYKAPSNGSYPTSQNRIVVGPGEWIVGYATSSLFSAAGINGGTGVGQLPVLTSCTYKILWEN